VTEKAKILKLVKSEEKVEESSSEITIAFLEDLIKDIRTSKLNIVKLGLVLMVADPESENGGFDISYQDIFVNNLPEALGLLECAKQVVLASN